MLSRTQIKKLKDKGKRISGFAAKELARSSALAQDYIVVSANSCEYGVRTRSMESFQFVWIAGLVHATDDIAAAYLVRMQWRRYHIPDGTLSISWTPASGLNHLKQRTFIAATDPTNLLLADLTSAADVKSQCVTPS
ncbi:hypothetical protein LIPSTDRAFT_75712 [Lipomyces starkeyi NRRL Y-11557]|uniref:Uncharacterized protein n=1 Tax=Lipomyces starkeyi NRRL Y-11557 TaxID=675824 RepID=A0A1E3PXE2_LIPST|nr:hypothetical protein LIPSTDRAFT_75712 [Lipomyces starkeyi NRRL Y-11557]